MTDDLVPRIIVEVLRWFHLGNFGIDDRGVGGTRHARCLFALAQ
jgi:hypothetical protein